MFVANGGDGNGLPIGRESESAMLLDSLNWWGGEERRIIDDADCDCDCDSSKIPGDDRLPLPLPLPLPLLLKHLLGNAFFFLLHHKPNGVLLKIFGFPERRHRLRLVGSARASLSTTGQGSFDPDLRSVLELATDSELYELEDILFGPSYFSPLLKSITNRSEVDYAMIDKDLEERENFIASLESRFLFLAADARSTLSEEFEASSGSISNTEGGLELGLSGWKVQALSAIKEFRSVILKVLSLNDGTHDYSVEVPRLCSIADDFFCTYGVGSPLDFQGGQVAAINLESRAALLAAKQGLTGAASRYLGFRSMMTLLGPMLWGTFLADVVIQMLGTDYARILRAIYAFAQMLIIIVATRLRGSYDRLAFILKFAIK
ncbi:hypothetical protein TIFTF001_020607 [Ficus carica]|uniref:Uncharacterized protein n=1 Tax=Ficus carica TaxID=3494 RepID=A0AA88D9Y2_FICCA|nr:hypothetical protein TIFTF001_020607 [Ficus carica]